MSRLASSLLEQKVEPGDLLLQPSDGLRLLDARTLELPLASLKAGYLVVCKSELRSQRCRRRLVPPHLLLERYDLVLQPSAEPGLQRANGAALLCNGPAQLRPLDPAIGDLAVPGWSPRRPRPQVGAAR